MPFTRDSFRNQAYNSANRILFPNKYKAYAIQSMNKSFDSNVKKKLMNKSFNSNVRKKLFTKEENKTKETEEIKYFEKANEPFISHKITKELNNITADRPMVEIRLRNQSVISLVNNIQKNSTLNPNTTASIIYKCRYILDETTNATKCIPQMSTYENQIKPKAINESLILKEIPPFSSKISSNYSRFHKFISEVDLNNDESRLADRPGRSTDIYNTSTYNWNNLVSPPRVSRFMTSLMN